VTENHLPDNEWGMSEEGGTMSWFGALWMIIRIGIALAFGKAGFSRTCHMLMPGYPNPAALRSRTDRSHAAVLQN